MPRNILSNYTSLLLLIILTLMYSTSIFAHKCYICDSKNDIECTENPPKNWRLVPQECTNITGAKYCIKTTNIYAGEFGTKRFCASNDHGNYCKYIRQPTGNREYRGCVLTCDSDGCNGSSALFDRHNFLYVASIAIFLCYHILLTTLTRNMISISD